MTSDELAAEIAGIISDTIGDRLFNAEEDEPHAVDSGIYGNLATLYLDAPMKAFVTIEVRVHVN